MRKKALALIVALVFVTVSLSAGVTSINRQMIYSVDSPVYEAIKYLYIAEGKALASTTGPWSAAELDIMMDRLEPERMSPSSRNIYDWIMGELNATPRLDVDEKFGADIGLKVAVDASYHTNADEFYSPDVIGGRGDYRPMLPMLSVPLETWIGDFLYGYSSFDLGINRSYKEGLKGENFFTNIWMVPPCVMDEINCNFPLRAIGSMGGENWNFSIGRDKVSWGNGESGNLMIGDHLPYLNTARLTGFSDKFKYTFLLSSFAHPANYTNPDGTLIYDTTTEYEGCKDRTDYFDWKPKKGMRMFVGHRLEWRIIDKIGMALTESIMYQSAENKFDLMILSPTAVFHNYYIRGNANSLLSFDIDYTPCRFLNIYAQMIIDEFQLPGECDPVGPPSASGYIGGVKTSVPLGNGMFYGSLEAAYTDPYLYLRNNPGNDGGTDYGINFIVATPEFGNGAADNYTLDFLGYRYGNDNIVGNLNVGYKVFGSWFVDCEYTYMADGCFDMNTRWRNDIAPHGENDPNAPTKTHGTNGTHDATDNTSLRNDIAHWNIVSLKGGVTLFRNLDIWGEMNYINIINFQNIKGRMADDFQVSLGISYYI